MAFLYSGSAPVRGSGDLPVRTRREWPGPATRQDSLMLEPAAPAARTARAHVAKALTRWGLDHLSDTAQLITSELVTNAIERGTTTAPSGHEPLPVVLSIAARDGELIIRVWDPDPTPPPRDQEQPAADAESGRGLVLVNELSHQWGTYPAPNGGKFVWATLRQEEEEPPKATEAEDERQEDKQQNERAVS